MSTTALTAVGYCAFALALSQVTASAQTLAHWNFDSGTAGASLASIPANEASGGPNFIYGYDDQVGGSYSADTADGSGLSCRVVNQDGYTIDPIINRWSPVKWTIEISVKLDELEGWNTIIGRDGSSQSDQPKSDFYFQNNQGNNHYRLDFATADGARYILESEFTPIAGAWYHIALVSDGLNVEMYIDRTDGEGYKLTGSTALSRKLHANNALASSGANWTFGRGWYGGKYSDNIVGNLDDIRFTDGALAPSQFLHAAPAKAAAPTLDIARSGQDVSLAWKLPSESLRKLEIFRHDREDPAGRTSIATSSSMTEVYLDRVPSKTTVYWYWVVAIREDGRIDSIGPVAARSSDVWAP